MKRNCTLLATVLSVAALSAGTQSANAGGWLADTFIRPISPELARAADDWNRRAGRPVEAAVASAAEVYVPGSGAVLQGAWAIQRAQQNAGGSQHGAPMPPTYAPPNVPYHTQQSRPSGRGPMPASVEPYYPQSSYGGSQVCRAGMYFVTNRGAGAVGTPCGFIVDHMGSAWPAFFAPN